MEEIDVAGTLSCEDTSHFGGNRFDYVNFRELMIIPFPVQEAARTRKESFSSSNPLSLGGGGIGARGGNITTPLGWLTGKLTGVGAR